MSTQEICIALMLIVAFVSGFLLRETQSRRAAVNRAVNLTLLPFIIWGAAVLISYAVDSFALHTFLAMR